MSVAYQMQGEVTLLSKPRWRGLPMLPVIASFDDDKPGSTLFGPWSKLPAQARTRR